MYHVYIMYQTKFVMSVNYVESILNYTLNPWFKWWIVIKISASLDSQIFDFIKNYWVCDEFTEAEQLNCHWLNIV